MWVSEKGGGGNEFRLGLWQTVANEDEVGSIELTWKPRRGQVSAAAATAAQVTECNQCLSRQVRGKVRRTTLWDASRDVVGGLEAEIFDVDRRGGFAEIKRLELADDWLLFVKLILSVAVFELNPKVDWHFAPPLYPPHTPLSDLGSELKSYYDEKLIENWKKSFFVCV